MFLHTPQGNCWKYAFSNHFERYKFDYKKETKYIALNDCVKHKSVIKKMLEHGKCITANTLGTLKTQHLYLHFLRVKSKYYRHDFI